MTCSATGISSSIQRRSAPLSAGTGTSWSARCVRRSAVLMLMCEPQPMSISRNLQSAIAWELEAVGVVHPAVTVSLVDSFEAPADRRASAFRVPALERIGGESKAAIPLGLINRYE